jgi:hypothetical protein
MRRRNRRADRPPVVMRRGDRVTDSRLRARVLGLPLLDIDVHVVVATAREGTGTTVIGLDERVRRQPTAPGRPSLPAPCACSPRDPTRSTTPAASAEAKFIDTRPGICRSSRGGLPVDERPCTVGADTTKSLTC